jgi:hypothetical protein
MDTDLLKVRHMSRPKYFYLGPPNSISKHALSNVCGLHTGGMLICYIPSLRCFILATKVRVEMLITM